MSEPTAADVILQRVAARLGDRARWHGEAASREGDLGCGGGVNARGEQVSPLDPTAQRHCLIGAFKVETGIARGWPLPGAAGEAYDRVSDAAGWLRHTCRNDEEGYDAVIGAVRRAIDSGPARG